MLAAAFGVESTHLVGRQTHGRCLQAQADASCAGIEGGPAIGLVIVAKILHRNTEYQNRRVLRPQLVLFREAAQQCLPCRSILVFIADDESPRLFVETRRCPARGFQQGCQGVVVYRFVSIEGTRAPAIFDDVVYRKAADGGFAVHGHVRKPVDDDLSLAQPKRHRHHCRGDGGNQNGAGGNVFRRAYFRMLFWMQMIGQCFQGRVQ